MLLAPVHTIRELQSPLSSTDTHLICLSDSSDDYATSHKLLLFQKWLNLTHQDMFIHGPFDFASVNGRKTWDRISQSDWDILKTHCICSTTLFHALMFPHILFMLIAKRTHHFMMLPLPISYLFWVLSVLTHRVQVWCMPRWIKKL